MTNRIATTREQSDRLLKCGVSADTADMFYQTPITVSQKATREDMLLVRKADKALFDTDTPAWSLSALLGLLPKTISDFWMTKWYDPTADGFVICDKETPYLLSGDFQLLHIGGGKYQVEYDWDGFQGRLPQSDNPIEACVLTIELLTANGYKLNEIKEK